MAPLVTAWSLPSHMSVTMQQRGNLPIKVSNLVKKIAKGSAKHESQKDTKWGKLDPERQTPNVLSHQRLLAPDLQL